MEDDSELVLERIMEDGTFDELRKIIVGLVKQDEQLNKFIEEAVLNSKALVSSKADSRGRQEDVYNSVRREIEGKALDRALAATWKVLQDESTGLSANIEQKVRLLVILPTQHLAFQMSSLSSWRPALHHYPGWDQWGPTQCSTQAH